MYVPDLIQFSPQNFKNPPSSSLSGTPLNHLSLILSYSIDAETKPLLSILAGSAPGFNDCLTLTLSPRLEIYSSVPTVID